LSVRSETVGIPVEKFRRHEGGRTGESLIDAVLASPYRDMDIEPKRDRMPVREINLATD
jgi:hypothetical protein